LGSGLVGWLVGGGGVLVARGIHGGVVVLTLTLDDNGVV
jgi:hypothetical protein